VHTVAALVRYADHFAVDMPIANAVFQIVHQNARIQDVIQQLLARPLRHETESIPRP
jgi:glycerol-3-phosphate dehydrogenase